LELRTTEYVDLVQDINELKEEVKEIVDKGTDYPSMEASWEGARDRGIDYPVEFD